MVSMYAGVTIYATPFSLQEGSAQEILLTVIEFILSTGETAERIAIASFLQVVQRTTDTLVSVLVVGEEGDTGPSIDAAINLRVIEDIYNTALAAYK